MTKPEQTLADDKMRAEISKLIAETAAINRKMKVQFWLVLAAYLGALVVILKIFG